MANVAYNHTKRKKRVGRTQRPRNSNCDTRSYFIAIRRYKKRTDGSGFTSEVKIRIFERVVGLLKFRTWIFIIQLRKVRPLSEENLYQVEIRYTSPARAVYGTGTLRVSSFFLHDERKFCLLIESGFVDVLLKSGTVKPRYQKRFDNFKK